MLDSTQHGSKSGLFLFVTKDAIDGTSCKMQNLILWQAKMSSNEGILIRKRATENANIIGLRLISIGASILHHVHVHSAQWDNLFVSKTRSGGRQWFQ